MSDGAAISPAAAALAELSRLSDALVPLLGPPDVDGLLRQVTAAARRSFGAAACSLALLSDDGGELVYLAADGAGADQIVGVHLPAGQGLAGWVAVSGQPVAVDDLSGDRRFARAVAEGTGYVPQALLAVPVSTPSRLLGVLTVLDRDATRPGADADMTTLSLFAAQAALALEAATASRRAGALLLAAAAGLAENGGPLDAALRELADAAADDEDDRRADLAELAALLARLDAAGPAERRLAVRVVGDVLDYTRARHG